MLHCVQYRYTKFLAFTVLMLPSHLVQGECLFLTQLVVQGFGGHSSTP